MVFAQGAKISPRNPAETERDRPQERARWFLRGRTVDGRPASQQLHRAYTQKLNNRRLQSQPRQASPRPMFVAQPAGGPVWTPLGPAPTATAAFNSSQQDYGPAVGRVTAVLVDQADTTGNTVYIGGASGGLWTATNAVSASRACNGNGVCTAPVVWTPLIDGEASLTVGSIALQPGNSNLILVGTGEANNSADSYYGLGILRSTDRGATWNLITQTADGAYKFHGLGFTHIAFSTDNPNVVVATAAAASAGINLGAETDGAGARGLYYSSTAGLTWSRANVSDAPDAGSANAVIYNPVQQKFYANLRYHGFYSSADGATWTRLATQPPAVTAACTPTTNSSCPLYRAEMAIVPGRDEMYVWIIDSQENDRGIFQTKDGGQTWNSISTAGIDNCGDSLGCGTGADSQATYNITLAAVPNGSNATDLYAGGINQYKCSINPSNTACTSPGFLNLTHVYGCSPAGKISHVHPDEHGIDFLGNDVTGDFFAARPSFDPPVFFGNDGGVYRALKSSQLTGGSCTSPTNPFDNLNSSTGFSMLQFVGMSQHPADSTTLLGGTQDNGSPAVSSAAPSGGSWLSVNNGDGGFNDINPLNPAEWFTSNPAPLESGGGIQRCASGISCTNQSFSSVVTQDKIGGDYSAFYTFFMLDPQASGRMLVGSCRVWRGNSDGSGSDWSVAGSGGNPLTLNLDTQVAASCANPTASPTTFMVNTIAAGGPCNGTACNPGITPASGTGGGSQVIWAGMEGIADLTNAAAECPPGGSNAKPCGGQVWRTLSADSGPGSWTEVSGLNSGTSAVCTSVPSACNINPGHYTISGIALDPKDATGKTAYVTVMGFGIGHVFQTKDAGATWVNLDGDPNGTGLPDAPADAVIADPNVANLVYVGTDVGVFKSTGNGVWTELGPSTGPGAFPNVAVTQLKIYNNPSDSIPLRLRASTYGRGIWEIPISQAPGYTMVIANSPLLAFAGRTAGFSGAITPFNGYNSSINVTCTSGATAPPSTCPNSGSPVVIPAPATSGSFTVTAGHSTVGDFSFNLTAVGSDPKGVTFQSPVTLHSVDFAMGAVAAANVGAGDSADVNFDVIALGAFTGDVNLTCSGQPAGTSCTFSPAVVTLTPGATANVRLTIPTSSSTTPGSYTVTITGASTLGSVTQSHTTALALTMTVKSASQSFSITATSAISPATAKPGQALTAGVNISSASGFAGTLALSCAFDGAAGSPGASTCNVNPASVILAASQTLPATVTVNTAGALAGNPRLVVTATDAANHASNSVNFDYNIVDYAVTLGAVSPTVPGNSTSVGLTIAGQNGFAGTVDASCAAPSPLTCVLNPTGPFTLSATATSASATATISAPANTTPDTYSVALNTSDHNFPSLAHNQIVSVGVQNFQMSGTPTAEIVKAGGTPTAHVINITGQGGFNDAVTLACSSGLPALSTCTFSPATVNRNGSSTLTIQTTAPSVAQANPSGRRGAPFYALWLTLPGMIVGLVGFGALPRNRRGKLSAYAALGLLLALLLAQTACGGGGGGSTTTPPIPKPGTPAGTYTITVTGTSGSGATALSHSIPITLTVQ